MEVLFLTMKRARLSFLAIHIRDLAEVIASSRLLGNRLGDSRSEGRQVKGIGVRGFLLEGMFWLGSRLSVVRHRSCSGEWMLFWRRWPNRGGAWFIRIWCSNGDGEKLKGLGGFPYHLWVLRVDYHLCLVAPLVRHDQVILMGVLLSHPLLMELFARRNVMYYI